MKLFLLSATLVLMPLALAALPSPAVKFVYDSRFLDTVFTEMNNATVAKYNYHYFDGSELHFMAGVNNTGLPTRSHINDYYLMDIKGQLGKSRDQNLSFVVEAYANEKGYDPRQNMNFCMNNSEPHLRQLIKSCFSRIILRNLTKEEETEMTKVQDRYQNFFEVTYNKGQVKARSALLNEFKINVIPKSQDGVNAQFNVTTFDHVWRERSMALKNSTLADRSFTIQALAYKSNKNCYETDSNLKPYECKGDLKLVGRD